MQYAGRRWVYSYRRLFDICSERKLTTVANRIAAQYATLTQDWTCERNSEWSCRTYFTTKMILNATVLLNSLEFARNSGLRSANPYFEYYALLSLLRGLVYMIPTEEWNEGELMAISHARAINVAFDWIAKFDKDLAAELKKTAMQLKAQRELIAYKAPASGDRNLGQNYDLVDFLTILAEISEFNSELLEGSITKNADPSSFEVLDDHIHQIATIEVEGFIFSDNEDYWRLGYVQRKTKRPYHLGLFMHPGQSEDFIGAWDGDENEGESFSNGPPSNWQAIFDVP
ncbi:hypothetical protein LKR43_15740 [Pusillimonas sp. MFBS29]|uniref:hypothetical protein n=1 Tax=Pusillimonas sp. MFBS29 TaxID=2886690 RepID=UPI001D0F5F1F|nr:hypothetical protein [Pusillimonas sp. MFBS29]MCC2597786.1 hypothetical protein [Pusillimonas sp. MFBS29]